MQEEQEQEQVPEPFNFEELLELVKQIKAEVRTLRSIFKTTEGQLKSCLGQTNIMKSLLMDLLDLAQLENNQFSLNKEYFNLYEALDLAKETVSHLAEQKGIVIEVPT